MRDFVVQAARSQRSLTLLSAGLSILRLFFSMRVHQPLIGVLPGMGLEVTQCAYHVARHL